MFSIFLWWFKVRGVSLDRFQGVLDFLIVFWSSFEIMYLFNGSQSVLILAAGLSSYIYIWQFNAKLAYSDSHILSPTSTVQRHSKSLSFEGGGYHCMAFLLISLHSLQKQLKLRNFSGKQGIRPSQLSSWVQMPRVFLCFQCGPNSVIRANAHIHRYRDACMALHLTQRNWLFLHVNQTKCQLHCVHLFLYRMVVICMCGRFELFRLLVRCTV